MGSLIYAPVTMALLAAVWFVSIARGEEPPAVNVAPPAFTETALLAAPPPGPYAVRVAVAKPSAPPPQIATGYLYARDDPNGAGVRYADGTDAFPLHPARAKGYTYKSVAWHTRELSAMRDAGIDVVLPAYWGNPADRALKSGAGLRWSFDGLKPLTEAAGKMNKTGRKSPKIGLFYDTSTLRDNAARYQPDLATNDGRAWLYTSLRDFWSLIPARLRATGPNGGPLCFIAYTGPENVKNGVGDAALWEYVRAHFAADFGIEPYLVLQNGWKPSRDGVGDAAFPQASAPTDGLQTTGGVATLGPGVDQRAGHGMVKIFRDRENGAFYENQWRRLLAQSPVRRPRIALVESWNQWQQATAIAPSREYGDKYVRLTRKWADLFHRGARIPLPASSPYRKAARVSWFAASPDNDEKGGIRLVAPPDGAFSLSAIAPGGPFAEAAPNPHGSQHHLYFDVNDHYLYDADDAPASTIVTLNIEYWDEGQDLLRIQYDATETGQAKRRADDPGYTAAAEIARTNTHTWKTATVALPYPRFANRENGGADFRLQSSNTTPLRIRWVTLRRNGN